MIILDLILVMMELNVHLLNPNDKIYPIRFIPHLTFQQHLTDLYLGTYDIEPIWYRIVPNGKRLFIVGTRGNGVDEFRLTPGFDIQQQHTKDFILQAEILQVYTFTDGLKFFIVGNVIDTVQEYTTDGSYRIVAGTGTGVVRSNTQSEFQQNPTTNGDTTFVDVTADTFTADNLTVNKNISAPTI